MDQSTIYGKIDFTYVIGASKHGGWAELRNRNWRCRFEPTKDGYEVLVNNYPARCYKQYTTAKAAWEREVGEWLISVLRQNPGA